METKEISSREAQIQSEIARLRMSDPQTGRSDWEQNLGNIAIFGPDGIFIKFVVNEHGNKNSSRTGSADDDDLTLADIAVLSFPGSSQRKVE